MDLLAKRVQVCGVPTVLQLDDAAPGGDCDRLSAIVGAEFVHDVLHMYLDGLLRDEEFRGDVAIPVAGRDLLQDFHLTLAQSFVAQMLGKAAGNLRGNAFLTGMDLPDHVEHLLGRHALQQVSTSPRLERPLHVDIAFECRQHDDARVGKLRSDGDHHVEAAEIREAEVHQSNVGSQGAKGLNPFPAVRGGPD